MTEFMGAKFSELSCCYSVPYGFEGWLMVSAGYESFGFKPQDDAYSYSEFECIGE